MYAMLIFNLLTSSVYRALIPRLRRVLPVLVIAIKKKHCLTTSQLQLLWTVSQMHYSLVFTLVHPVPSFQNIYFMGFPFRTPLERSLRVDALKHYLLLTLLIREKVFWTSSCSFYIQESLILHVPTFYSTILLMTYRVIVPAAPQFSTLGWPQWCKIMPDCL